jgi:hypothetical protein
MNGPDYKPPPAVTGKETDAELQALILRFTQKYSDCTSREKCMIRSLSGLTFNTLQTVVKGFKREFCLEILRAECTCRKEDTSFKKKIP